MLMLFVLVNFFVSNCVSEVEKMMLFFYNDTNPLPPKDDSMDGRIDLEEAKTVGFYFLSSLKPPERLTEGTYPGTA